MQDIEKLGAFYLGRVYDHLANRTTDDVLLYDSKDLTTHAVCVGMTGSGKTGLCVTLLEEAAIDGIPSICIDPKGDLTNLALAFPELRPSDFRPWIDEAEAARKGATPDAYAESTAGLWRRGLADWGQDPARIARLKAAADVSIYTPGANAGLQLSVLRSFSAPSPAVAGDPTALRDRIMSAVSGLLALVGLSADPIKSREHILISNILHHAWQKGESLDIAGIIRAIHQPPFDVVGVFDIESFFPAADRMALAMRINNLLASPGFSAWMEGEPLDIQRLLFTTDGKPRISILSIAHLSDPERMFFVTILLNELVAWMRVQSGTSSLRALLYMDEIFGYFPPTAMPPSKIPMLTLLKQARAFGLGTVLSTQNPVDLDYKGLANAGTWLIGRLQTERDKARVMEGLEGALLSQGTAFDRGEIEARLAGLGNRVFLMRNVHEEQLVLFQTRWALSYLRGPMTLPQIALLTQAHKDSIPRQAPTPSAQPAALAPAQKAEAEKPIVPSTMEELYLKPSMSVFQTGSTITYRAAALGVVHLHFVDAKRKLDVWQTRSYSAPFSSDGSQALWEDAAVHADLKPYLESTGMAKAQFQPPAAGALRGDNVASWRSSLAKFLHRTAALDLIECRDPKAVSHPGESEGDFRSRVSLAVREERDARIEKLRKKYAPRLASLQERLLRADQRIQREQSQVSSQKMDTALSVGSTVLGALFGRKTVSTGTIGRAATTMRRAGKISKEKRDVEQATKARLAIQERLGKMEAEFNQEIARIQDELDVSQMKLQRIEVRPRKSDITVETTALLWLPFQASSGSGQQPAYTVSQQA
ncbi:MAG: ATP-binding protein [Verrucomicrobia bacterium]|nr:ATP-binding protein [Verrucomicrobiota bacterium]